MRNFSVSTAGGFALIEVLVTALIMGIGLLGLVGLQTRALQLNQQAYFYSQAVFLAHDIAERMRANPGAASHYETGFDSEDEDLKNTTACQQTTCSAIDMAKLDIRIWKDNLAASLPGGEGAIKKEDGQYLIDIRFDDSHGTSIPTVRVQLRE